MSTVSNLSRLAGSFLYGAVTYKLCDGGLSKALALEELTHGTDPISNIKIRISGGQPSKPGYKPNYPDYTDTENYFYLYKDSEYNRIKGVISDYEQQKVSLLAQANYKLGKAIHKRVLLLDNTSNASIIQFRRYFQRTDPIEKKPDPVDFGAGTLGIILSPTLRFRFSKIDSTRLEEDTNHPGFAYKTHEVVESWRLGLVGSCLTGLNSDLLSRAKNHPLKVATGIAELGIASVLLLLGRSRIRVKLPWIIAGAALS